MRNISITAYVEWVLGPERSVSAPYIVTGVDPETGAMFARNPLSNEFGTRIAFTDLAGRLQRWRDQGTPAVTFLIGGTEGLAEPLRGRAELALCFGAATWPHQLVRIMLLEQIYRAMTILAGHPYHRD